TVLAGPLEVLVTRTARAQPATLSFALRVVHTHALPMRGRTCFAATLVSAVPARSPVGDTLCHSRPPTSVRPRITALARCRGRFLCVCERGYHLWTGACVVRGP